MDMSRTSIVLDTTNRVIQQGCATEGGEEGRDQVQCENNPSPFCAEQTWPTEEEIKNAQQKRKVSGADDLEMEMINTESKTQVKVPNVSGFVAP